MGSEDSVIFVLLGRTGSGKSTLGNHLLGWPAFESRLCAGRVTQTVSEKTSSNRFGHMLVAVDTPDFTRKEVGENEVTAVLPIPVADVFLFVTSVEDDPNTLEESIETLQNQFTDNILRYILVVFTREHDLRLEQRPTSSEDYFNLLPHTLKQLLGKCRYMFLDNSAEDDEMEAKLRELMNKVDEMRRVNYHKRFCFENRPIDVLRQQGRNMCSEEMFQTL